ncbi:hypothetical protein VTN00DRAFT_6584 [Thermoascus crustaceus]|uniref:uncharacterized protein n=1 Tax=Thermoascus crustaceus TaxID=5088 RepID=UPI003744A61A
MSRNCVTLPCLQLLFLHWSYAVGKPRLILIHHLDQSYSQGLLLQLGSCLHKYIYHNQDFSYRRICRLVYKIETFS